MSKKEKMKNYKGMAYRVKGTTVTVYDEAGSELISGELKLGVSIYHTVQRLVNSLKVKESNGLRKIGNFNYLIEEDLVTISRNNGDVLTTVKFTEKELGKNQVRDNVMKVIVSIIE